MQPEMKNGPREGWRPVMFRVLIVGLSVAVLSGCAARGRTFATRFVKPGEPATTFDTPAFKAPEESLADYGRRVRALQANAKTKSSLLPTIESQDAALAAALVNLAVNETATNHRLVAHAYFAAGVSDFAHRHYQRALRVEPCDSESYEGLARVWRSWGRADLALGDSYRAIHCQPRSASAYNTLGTVLAALGQRDNARKAFEFALKLDGTAVFALNNLCYLAVDEGNGVAAQHACEKALMLEPTMRPAQTNLALAFALQGDVKSAERRLMETDDRAMGHYNVGILRMAMRKYSEALESFELALKVSPSLPQVSQRAAQARALAEAQREQ